jgi:hypothetical protein
MFEILQGFLIIFAVEFNHLRWDLGGMGFGDLGNTQKRLCNLQNLKIFQPHNPQEILCNTILSSSVEEL